ncbi:MAG: hypothetical protein EA366_14720 [Spirulina sp. DLM2.Bin59]|nr:MAG: hypothetical protein EA366_14720 [Spirulina sp. DLM2.Bin59]
MLCLQFKSRGGVPQLCYAVFAWQTLVIFIKLENLCPPLQKAIDILSTVKLFKFLFKAFLQYRAIA